MKSITRLSLALMMFGLFSVSYLVTTVSAQQDYNKGIKNQWGVKPQTHNRTADGVTHNNLPGLRNNSRQGNGVSIYNGNVQGTRTQQHNSGQPSYNVQGTDPTAPHQPDNTNDRGASGSSYRLNQPVNQGGVNGVLPGPR